MTPRLVSAVVAALVLAVTAAPATAQPPDSPAITVEPTEITSVQGQDELVAHELTIGNAGDATLDWQAFQFGDDPRRLPIRPATPVQAAPVPDPGGSATLAVYPGNRGRPGWTVEPPAPAPDPLTVTHSESPTIVAGSSVACTRTRGATTSATSYLRHFTLDDFGVVGALDVTSAAFGVESLTGTSQTITVNLYTMVDPGGLFGYDNFQPIGTATATIGRQAMTIVEVPVTGTAPAGSTLVVEVAVPDMSRGGFFIGANPGGQTAASYLRAEACGIPQPAPTAALGAPDMQFLLSVTGVTEQPSCDVPAHWVDLVPRSGAVAAGAGQPVQVSFDSTGRPVGDLLEAELCLLSNDPHRALVVVPLAMRVVSVPAIEVSPAAIAARQRAGTVPAQPLTIGNSGDGALEWEIGEAGVAGCGTVEDVPWLAVSPDTGATAARESTGTTVSFDVTGLTTGDHQAGLCVASNDPATPLVEVPVTVTVTVTCQVTIAGPHPAPLTVTDGVTCLAPGAQIQGEVNVFDGAGLAANSAVIQGPLATFGATTVELGATQVTGPISIRGTTGPVMMSGSQVVGSVLVVNNLTGGTPIVISGNWIVGSLFCTGNQPPPVDGGAPNMVIGGMKLDQCAPL